MGIIFPPETAQAQIYKYSFSRNMTDKGEVHMQNV